MKILFRILLILIVNVSYSQEKDTIIILFDNSFSEMKKAEYYFPDPKNYKEEIKKSVTYYIEPTIHETWSTEFSFSHVNRDKQTYEKFGTTPPLILKKLESYLNQHKVLDLEYLKETSYEKVCKTFEANDSWEQNVVLFIVDVDEIKGDSIVLREVDFSRPVNE